MKTSLLIAAFFFLSSFGFSQNFSSDTGKEGKTTGIYKGLNDFFEFVFITDGGTTETFQEVSDNVSVDLFDETTNDKRFEISWKELSVNLTDDEGEPTGEKSTVRRITSAKKIN